VSRSNKFRLAGAIAILIPALAGCEAGLNAPTLQYHPAAFGAYATPSSSTGAGITISNAFVLGPPVNQQLPAGSDAGVFMSLSSNSPNGDQLTKVTAEGAASATIQGGTVDLPANQPVNLTGPAPRIVLNNLTASLNGGSTITLQLTFANAAPVDITVPIEPQAYAYATYDQPAVPAPTPSDTATGAGATPSTGATSSAGTTAVHKHHAHASATPTPSPSA
jgi:copper(I)-binding protein